MLELEKAIYDFHQKMAETVLEPFSLTCNDDDNNDASTINDDTTIDGLVIDIVL